MTLKEYQLLRLLTARAGEVVARDELLHIQTVHGVGHKFVP